MVSTATDERHWTEWQHIRSRWWRQSECGQSIKLRGDCDVGGGSSSDDIAATATATDTDTRTIFSWSNAAGSGGDCNGTHRGTVIARSNIACCTTHDAVARFDHSNIARRGTRCTTTQAGGSEDWSDGRNNAS